MQTHAAPYIASTDLEDDDESPELQWFDRTSLRPIPSLAQLVASMPHGFSGDRAWRARGWSTED